MRNRYFILTLVLGAVLSTSTLWAQKVHRKEHELVESFAKRIKPDSTELVHQVLETKNFGTTTNAIMAFYNKAVDEVTQMDTYVDHQQYDIILGYLYLPTSSNTYRKIKIDTLLPDGGNPEILSVFYVNADQDQQKELAILCKYGQRHYDYSGVSYETHIYKYNRAQQHFSYLSKLSRQFTGCDCGFRNGDSEKADYKTAAAVKAQLKVIREKSYASKKNNSAQIEKKIKGLTKNIAAHRFLTGNGDNNLDSLEHWNNQLKKVLEESASSSPDFMENNFSFASTDGLVSLVSTDKNFKIICWNDGMSGTLQEWVGMAFWQSNTGVHSFELSANENSHSIGALMPEYLTIRDFKCQNGETVYWVTGIKHESNRFKLNFVKAFAIRNDGTLDKNYKFFKTPHKALNNIQLEIDLSSISPADGIPLIDISTDKKTMFVPIADEAGKITNDKYLIYKFNGHQFTYQGVK